MAPYDDTTPQNRFDSFDVYETSYKKIGSHGINVGVLVPKDLKPGKHPLIVRWHGGGLITGDALYPDWFAAFLIPFIHRASAITVLPNYRLLPEHNGEEIVSDVRDFYKWFHSGEFADFITSKVPGIELDFDRTLITGDSAGGYLALYSAMTQPKGTIRAVLLEYPMTNYLRTEGVAKDFMGNLPPKPEIIDEFVENIAKDAVVYSAIPPARLEISFALASYGRYLEFFGNNEKLWPIHLIEDIDYIPPTWIIHGDSDSAVSIEDSKAFVAKWGKRGLESEVRLEIREGQEHGFDGSIKESEEKWLSDGLKWVEGKWLQ